MTNEEKAAAVGEYVIDAIDVYVNQDPRFGDAPGLLPPVTLDQIYRATRIAARDAARAIGERWPKFGHDWR